MVKLCWKLLSWKIFFKKFGFEFSSANTTLAKSQEWHFRLIYNKTEVHRLDSGYNMSRLPLASLMTFTLGVSNSKFRNSGISGIVVLIHVKWKGSELIGYWADYMTLTFDHTHDLDLGVSRSESEIALSQEWNVWLTWNKKDVCHPFMTMILTNVTVVGWVDVPDSNWGDFRRRRAIDISSYSSTFMCRTISLLTDHKFQLKGRFYLIVVDIKKKWHCINFRIRRDAWVTGSTYSSMS